MFIPRNIKSDSHWRGSDGIKIYTISITDEPVDKSLFYERLASVKKEKGIDWPKTPAFVIFHKGERYLYLVLAWWGNDNELFTSVSVQTNSVWVEDPGKYSFCVFDMEIFWHERNIYIDTMYSESPNIEKYRNTYVKNV